MLSLVRTGPSHSHPEPSCSLTTLSLQPEDQAEAEANLAATGNTLGLALDDLLDQSTQKKKVKVEKNKTGHKLGVHLTGKRGSRSLKQAARKSKKMAKGMEFAERLVAKSEKLLGKKKGRLGLKSLY